METINIRNLSCPQTRSVKAVYCASFLCRLRGLTLRSSLPRDEGLLLVQARDSRLDASIHMLFVWMDLGVVWITDSMEVADTCLAKSWRLAYLPKKPARYVLEIHPERLDDFHIGDRVEFEKI